MPKIISSRKAKNYNPSKKRNDTFDRLLDSGLDLEGRRKSRDRIYNVDLTCLQCKYEFLVNINSALKGTVCPVCGASVKANPKDRNYKATKLNSRSRQAYRVQPFKY